MAKPEVHDESIDHMEEEFRALEGMGRRRWLYWLLGLVLIAVAAGAYWKFVGPAPARQTPTPLTSTGLVIETLAPRPGRLTAPPTHFAWESISGRQDYLFTLSAEGEKQPLVQRAVKNAVLDLTPEEVQLLVPGKSYVWRVTARKGGGTTLGGGQSQFQLR